MVFGDDAGSVLGEAFGEKDAEEAGDCGEESFWVFFEIAFEC